MQLTEEEQKLIEHEQMNKLLANNDITSCPKCARVVMIVPGEVDLGMKDDKGNPISH